MITCLHAPDLERLQSLDPEDGVWDGAELPSELPAASHLYFGVEFCPHLLPPPKHVISAFDWAQERGWGFTFLTPYVLEAQLKLAIEAVTELVARLEPEQERLEVVVNDWGLLRALKREFSGKVELVLGRALNRAQRDPRVPDIGEEHLGGDTPPSVWRRASHDSAAMRGFLGSVGVQRAETDFPLQGLLPPEGDATAIPLSLHIPYGMVASGRVCLVSSLGKPAAHRFTAPRSCDAPCKDRTLVLRAPWAKRDGGAGRLPILSPGAPLQSSRNHNRRRNQLPDPESDPAPRFFQKGNTHFYRLEAEGLDRAMHWLKQSPSVDRVVFSPQLPM